MNKLNRKVVEPQHQLGQNMAGSFLFCKLALLRVLNGEQEITIKAPLWKV